MCPHWIRVGRHQNRNLDKPLFWNNVYLVYARNVYGLDGTKTETLTRLTPIILNLHLNGKVLRQMPFLPNILTARLVKHVEEHGESIAKPDLTGHKVIRGNDEKESGSNRSDGQE